MGAAAPLPSLSSLFDQPPVTLTADVGSFSLNGLDAALQVAQTAQNVGHAQRIIYQIEIDGETEYYATPEAAEKRLREVYKRAKNVVRQAQRKIKHAPLPEPLKTPVIAVPDDSQYRQAVADYMAKLNALYAEVEKARQAELDDEDVLLLL